MHLAQSPQQKFFSSIRIITLLGGGFLFFVFGGPWYVRGFVGYAVGIFKERPPLLRDSEVLMLQAEISNLTREKERLEGLLAHRTLVSDRSIVAPVLLGGGYSFSDLLLLGKGREDGVSIDDVVVSDAGAVVGIISEVHEHSSVVAVLWRVGNLVVLRQGPEKNIVFEARGIGNEEYVLDMPAVAPIATGEALWWGGNPRYGVGLVDRIDQESSRQIKRVYVRAPLEPYYTSSLLIMSKAPSL